MGEPEPDLLISSRVLVLPGCGAFLPTVQTATPEVQPEVNRIPSHPPPFPLLTPFLCVSKVSHQNFKYRGSSAGAQISDRKD